jgi:TorA maturation chaperone TorD
MGIENLNLGENPLLLGKHVEDRSRIYMLLSTFYCQRPGEEFVRKLKTDEFIHTLRNALSEDDSKMREGLRILEMFVNSIKDMPEAEVAENLAVDFTRLFRGIKKGYGPPPPYESVYRAEGRVIGEWTQEVLKKYSEAGIGMDISDELPDYVGIELKFMALLSYKEAEAWKKSDTTKASKFLKLEQTFMEEHLQQWIPEFCNLMREEAKSSFYRGIAGLTSSFLILDRAQINVTLDTMD